MIPVSPGTAYQYRRLEARFDAYFLVHQADSLPHAFAGWLTTLPTSAQRIAKNALKRRYGPDACDWTALMLAPYQRNEVRLRRSILRADARGHLRTTLTRPADRALIECLWTLRRGDAAALRWADVDLGPGLVDVRHGKGGKASWTLLTRDAQSALAAWFTVAGEPADDAPVFPTPRGRHYRPDSLGHRVRKLLLRAGLWISGGGAAHRFRRSFATEYLRANEQDLAGLKQLMRHTNISTTMLYVFLDSDDLAPRLARMRL